MAGAEIGDRPVGLGQGGIRSVHRERGGEAGELFGMPVDELGHAVVGDLGELDGLFRRGEELNWRGRQRQDLLVLRELLHNANRMSKSCSIGTPRLRLPMSLSPPAMRSTPSE